MPDHLIVNKKKIFPGENQVIKLNVSRLPSGTVISLRIHVYRSENPGPVMLVLGGVHGDEINGVEIVRRTIRQGLFENLKAGSVIAIPLLNIYGFIHFSRDVSEGKDVNRLFPGNMSGSLASRVAATLTKRVLPAVDFGVDFHTGGGSRYNYPQIRYSKGDKKAEKLAIAFAAPYLLCKANFPKSLRKIAMGMKKPILVYEGGESLRFDGLSIEKGLAGLKRVMHSQRMGFAQITFNRLPKDTKQNLSSNLISKGFQELQKVWQIVKNQKNIKRFLFSFFFYSAGVQTVLYLASTFATDELKFGATDLILLILILQLVAIGGAYLFASLSNWKGNKIAIITMLVIWIGICVLAYFVKEKNQFFIIAALVGMVMGGIQSVSRSTYSKLIPLDTKDTASFFSFYDVLEKVAIVLGTFTFGFIDQMMGGMRNSILALIIYFVIGLLVLFTIKVKPAKIV